eukprot:CCRYP_001696-RA/>CCRYP_001696-RA protein AED:0.32 eAED:1.00 QI:0/-1/0/1/-1/0/1/0/88
MECLILLSFAVTAKTATRDCVSVGSVPTTKMGSLKMPYALSPTWPEPISSMLLFAGQNDLSLIFGLLLCPTLSGSTTVFLHTVMAGLL